MALVLEIPCNPEAEQSVIGAVLLRSDVLDEVVEILPEPQHFYRSDHQKVWQAVLDLYQRREPVDVVTVADLLLTRGQLDQVGGTVFLTRLGEQVGTAANAVWYARRVRELYTLRQFQVTLRRLLEASRSKMEDVGEFLSAAESEIYRTVRQESRDAPEPVGETIRACLAQMAEQRLDSLPPGTQTGYYDLDARIGGLEPHNLYVLAARPGMGKTALGLNIALNVARSGRQVLFLSLETSKAQLARRLLADLAGLEHQVVRDGCPNDEDWDRVQRAAAGLELPLYLDDQGALTHLDVRARARRAAAKWGIRLLVVDYLQLISAPEAKTREQEVATISRSLKALAKELAIPVLVLAQLNRACEARTDKRPVLSDLRESGAIEQEADVVAFIYRDDYYQEDSPNRGTAEILVRKNRHGATGTVKLLFHEKTVSFRNLAKDEPPF